LYIGKVDRGLIRQDSIKTFDKVVCGVSNHMASL
jgi:hypothetical protein